MSVIYLDCCALNRPLDDQRQAAIAADAEAIRQMLLLVRWGRVTWRGAPILHVEIEACADTERRAVLLSLLQDLCVEERITVRRDAPLLANLLALKLSLPDAVHVASAVQVEADIFITCDKLILKKCGRIEALAKLKIRSPLQALAELTT